MVLPAFSPLIGFFSVHSKKHKTNQQWVGLLAGWVFLLFASSTLSSLPTAPPRSFYQNTEYQASIQGAVVGSMRRAGDGAAETWPNSSLSFFFLSLLGTAPGQAGHPKAEQPALSEL